MSLTDRPNLAEMIDATRMHLETTILPAVKGDAKLYFQTLIAVNLLRIAGREAASGAEQARAAWADLNAFAGVDTPLPADDSDGALEARIAALCADVRAGRLDDRDDALFALLMRLTRAQLAINNPKLLEAYDRDDALDP